MPTHRGADAQAEKASAEVQKIVDRAEEKGYFGEVPDREPNGAYSLLSGPDAPPLAPNDRTRFAQPAFPKES